ncbi:hypothetical protein [Vibrio sp. EJY3]|uniref:hypothetical protein n=1 Tax=Vibrio sp. (strain EJY3) TaxID=1116375 RepID=UPI000243C0B1|nr:hypothetical protein [Vibrio sp. EJY3]AEX21752.1 hypothetical protein VEJY3_06290 [Vibrio sp. EJY3]
MGYLKKVEVWFYALFLAILATKLGVGIGSVSLEFGVMILNDLTIPKSELVARCALLLLGFFCATLNFKKLTGDIREAAQTHEYAVRFVTEQLQMVTKKGSDKVSKVEIKGWSNPVVNTGKWTSYEFARRDIVVDIPFELLVAVKVESFFIGLTTSSMQWLIPILISGGVCVETVI